MVDELWNDLVDELVDLIDRLVLFHASLELLADLAGKAAQVLVTPGDEISARSLQAELKCLSAIFLL